MTKKLNTIQGIAYGIISSATFGLIPLFAIPCIEAGININSLMCYRFGISVVLLTIWLLFKHVNLRLTSKEIVTIIWLGILYASTSIILTTSYELLPSGLSTTIHFMYPVVVTVISVTLFHEKLRKMTLAAIITAIGGVFLLCYGHSGGNISIKGILLVLVTVITYATYIVGVNHSDIKNMDGLKLTYYVLLTGFIVFLGKHIIEGDSFSPIPDVKTALNVTFLSLVPTLISDLSLIYAIQKVGPTTTAILGCMEPLTAVLMGVLFLGESIILIQIIGIIAIIAAVTTIIVRK